MKDKDNPLLQPLDRTTYIPNHAGNVKIQNVSCMHDACTKCHGTGKTESGELCVHFVYCNCKKCSPTC